MTDKKYILGLDLGLINDYSALSMLEQAETLERADFSKDIGEHYEVAYHLVHLQRFKLATQYPAVVQRVKEIMENPKIARNNHLILDATGVGTPVLQMFRAVGVNPVGVTLTAGAEVTKTSDSYEGYHVPKGQLVSTLMVLVQSGRLKIAEGLEHAPAFDEEMQNFHYTLDKKTGHDTYESVKDSVHDDLVVSVALAAWYAMRYERHMREYIYESYDGDEKNQNWNPLTHGLQ